MTSTDTKKIFHKIKHPLIMIKRLCKLGWHFSIWQTAPVQNPQQPHPEGVRGTVALRKAKHIHIAHWSMKNPAKFAKSLHVPHYQPYENQVLVTVRRVFYVSTAWTYIHRKARGWRGDVFLLHLTFSETAGSPAEPRFLAKWWPASLGFPYTHPHPMLELEGTACEGSNSRSHLHSKDLTLSHLPGS